MEESKMWIHLNDYYNQDIIFKEIQDLKQANSLAQLMIGNYGMGK